MIDNAIIIVLLVAEILFHIAIIKTLSRILKSIEKGK